MIKRFWQLGREALGWVAWIGLALVVLLLMPG